MNSTRLLALLAISGGLSAVAGQQAATLSDHSPFLQNGMAESQGTTALAGALELRGIMSGPSGYLYYIYDPAKRHGVWAGSDDTGNPFTILAGDASRSYLEIRTNDGQLIRLKLREAKIHPDGTDAATATASNAVAAPGRGSVVLTETQVAWREEFNRRLAENAASN